MSVAYDLLEADEYLVELDHSPVLIKYILPPNSQRVLLYSVLELDSVLR